ncbi:retrovirus-related Pol polyprotein from transposon 17.6 [Trichonephila clavipes]|nr:retrovirus-related Pol polyprotein from transposon 17.6 [Trichonephila clavipes]
MQNFGSCSGRMFQKFSNDYTITNHKTNTQLDRTVNTISILTPPKNLMNVEITISKIPITALCDTGSEANIINEKTYQKLGYPTLNPSQCTFSGIGRDRVESKDAIIRMDFVQQTHFTFGRDGIRIFCDVDECKNDDVLVNLADLFDEQQCKLDLPHISNSKIRKDVEQVEWLNVSIIKPSCSDYAAPIVLCKKKNGEHRLCVDYRNLNRKMIKDTFPLPLIDEVLEKLETSKVYTLLDLKNVFFQVPIDPNVTSTKDALDKLILQQTIFGNRSKIITDKGSAFTSTEFQNFCQDESIEHIQITTGVPRRNGQIERLHETIISVLTKLTFEEPRKMVQTCPPTTTHQE